MKQFGNCGVASSCAPKSPMAQLFINWMGVVNTLYALVDQPQEIEKALFVLDKADDPIYEIISEAPAPLVSMSENLSGDIVSPSIFGKYYAPYYRKRVCQLHTKGKFVYVHIDGRLKGLLPLLYDTGIDCAQALTPAPYGDTKIEEWRKLAGRNIVLWGGLPGPLFSSLYNENDLKDMVLRCIKCCLKDNRFILGVADQVPADGDIGRVRLVTKLVEKYGRRFKKNVTIGG